MPSCYLNLASVLEQHARRRPERIAIVYGERRLTYGQLNGWANRIAGGLAASLAWDTPAGPSVVAAAVVLFAASLLGGAISGASPA